MPKDDDHILPEIVWIVGEKYKLIEARIITWSPNVIHLCKADDPSYDPYWYTPKYVFSTREKALKEAVRQLEDDVVDQRRKVAMGKLVLHDMECMLESYKNELKNKPKGKRNGNTCG